MLHRKNPGIFLFSIAILMSITALEANAQVLDTINDSYKGSTSGWLSSILPIAKSLFWKLAAIEFAWSAIVWVLQQENMQSFTAVVVKKIMGIGFFYALLLHADEWIPAIINSFTKAGQTASGTSGLSPSSVMDMGINSANVLLLALHDKSIWDDLMTIVIGGLSALAIVLAFTIIAGQLLIALVESYIVISAGVLFLGFGGSRWTTDFTQKYLSYAVGTGVKLFMLYLIIGIGMTEAENWKTLLATAEYVKILSVLGGSLVLCFLAFQIPSLASSMLSGSPSLTAGGLAGTAAAIGAGVATAGGKVISPAMQGAKGGIQAVQAGVAHHRAAGSGMAASAVKGIGTAAKDYAREAGRSAAEAVGLASPSSSSSNTIGGRAAEGRRGATDAMREQQAASGSSAGSQVQPPAQASATNNSASNTSASNSDAPTGNKTVGDTTADGGTGSNAAAGSSAAGATASTATGSAAATREASDKMLDNAPQKMGSAAPQTTAQNTPATSKSDGKNEKPFFEPHQVRPPQIPNDAAPQASVNIRLNHDE